MPEFIISAFFFAVSIASVIVGTCYVKATRKAIQRNNDALNLQSAVKKDIARYAVNNRGASMDVSEVYTVDSVTLGY